MEPPATLNLSDKEITRLIKSGLLFEIGKLPCHSQIVERHIRLAIEAYQMLSLITSGAEARDGFIRSRIKSRNDLPKMNIFGPYVETEDDN